MRDCELPWSSLNTIFVWCRPYRNVKMENSNANRQLRGGIWRSGWRKDEGTFFTSFWRTGILSRSNGWSDEEDITCLEIERWRQSRKMRKPEKKQLTWCHNLLIISQYITGGTITSVGQYIKKYNIRDVLAKLQHFDFNWTFEEKFNNGISSPSIEDSSGTSRIGYEYTHARN